MPRSYRAEPVEAEVWAYVQRLYSEPQVLVDALDILIAEERALSGDPEGRIKAIARKLSDLDRRKENAQSKAVLELLADGTLDPAMIRSQLAELEDQRRDLERELEACDNRGQRVRDLERLRGACVQRAESWRGIEQQWPDLRQYVIGPMPWETDAFARGFGGDLANATPQERHQHYRELGIKVHAMPEGGIRIDGEIVQGYMKQVGCVRVEPTYCCSAFGSQRPSTIPRPTSPERTDPFSRSSWRARSPIRAGECSLPCRDFCFAYTPNISIQYDSCET